MPRKAKRSSWNNVKVSIGYPFVHYATKIEAGKTSLWVPACVMLASYDSCFRLFLSYPFVLIWGTIVIYNFVNIPVEVLLSNLLVAHMLQSYYIVQIMLNYTYIISEWDSFADKSINVERKSLSSSYSSILSIKQKLFSSSCIFGRVVPGPDW